MDGSKFCVFDRSVLVSNGPIHSMVSLFDVLLRKGFLHSCTLYLGIELEVGHILAFIRLESEFSSETM